MHSHLTEAMITYANRSNKYWLSAFRSFRVHAQYSQNIQACLSVTRTGNYLTLQPDDCGITHKYICANDIEEGYNNRTDVDNGKDGDNNNDFQGIVTRLYTKKDCHPVEESNSPDNHSNPKNTKGIVIGMIASVVVVVSLLIGGILCLRRRKAATKKAHRSLMGKSSIDTNVIKDTITISNTTKHCVNCGYELREEHEYAGPEDVTNTVSSTNPNNFKIRPDKPARNTLRRNQKINETYENFKLVSTENRKVDENEEECHGDVVTKTGKGEYDVLCHNMAAPLTKQERAEIHVYDHTHFQNNDNEGYDSTLPGRGNKHKPAGNVDDYDTVNLSNNEKIAKKNIFS
ncbi:uncharacterized protein LOC128240152 [Mya arenaria]|uniref:uncharacterized protein LOC128240152 n=1 Tax=Mya arenaria TaxID=6604 RepID=UPI0022E6FF4F|nr:uncharacterized protein LOC128240152 [Mya arenaria]